jgi:hypothetical protein
VTGARHRLRVGVAALTVWAVTLACACPGPAAAAAAPSPIGVHSMVQLNDPPSFMATMFAEAAAMGASTIRLDVAPAIVFGDSPASSPDFSGLDVVMALSAQYHLRVVADLMTVPAWLADCPPSSDLSGAERCATDRLDSYASLIRQIVAYADPVIRDWEIWNEPDSGQFFHGTATQYAWMLRTAHDAIKRVDPQAQVLLGGLSGTAGSTWLSQVVSVPGADAAGAFDVANVHERGWVDGLAGDIRAWRQFFADHGFTGPLWVTEHGYPADPAFQYDPSYAGGPGNAGGSSSQAAYLTASLPTLLDAGAAQVLVTERDNLGGQFSSEGILGGNVMDPSVADPQVIERPAYRAVRTMAACYAATGRDCLSAAPVPVPAAATFAAVRLGAAAQSTVTLSDPGTEPIALGTASLAGAPPGVLALAPDGCSGQILEPGRTCPMTIRFTPAGAGTVAATLELPSDSGAIGVPVSASSPSVSSLTSSPATRDGGGPDGAGHPQRLRVTLTNPLAGPVHVAAAAVAGGRFSLTSNGCARTTLRPGTSCALTVLWRPRSAGTGRGTLTVRGDGRPLAVNLRPVAFTLPTVTRLHLTRGGDCLPDRGGVARATVVQPATLSWTLRRAPHASEPHCGRSRATPAATAAAGRQFTLTLPGHRRPGTYRLTARAGNRHGQGPARVLWLTVA